MVIWAEKRLLLLLKMDFLACLVAFSHFIWTTYCMRCRHDVKNKVTMTVVRMPDNRVRGKPDLLFVTVSHFAATASCFEICACFFLI